VRDGTHVPRRRTVASRLRQQQARSPSGTGRAILGSRDPVDKHLTNLGAATRVRPDAGAADRSHPLPRAGGPRPRAHQQSHWQLSQGGIWGVHDVADGGFELRRGRVISGLSSVKRIPVAPAGRPATPDRVEWLAAEMLKTRVAHGCDATCPLCGQQVQPRPEIIAGRSVWVIKEHSRLRERRPILRTAS
jgi:hypothetical protein